MNDTFNKQKQANGKSLRKRENLNIDVNSKELDFDESKPSVAALLMEDEFFTEEIDTIVHTMSPKASSTPRNLKNTFNCPTITNTNVTSINTNLGKKNRVSKLIPLSASKFYTPKGDGSPSMKYLQPFRKKPEQNNHPLCQEDSDEKSSTLFREKERETIYGLKGSNPKTPNLRTTVHIPPINSPPDGKKKRSANTPSNHTPVSSLDENTPSPSFFSSPAGQQNSSVPIDSLGFATYPPQRKKKFPVILAQIGQDKGPDVEVSKNYDYDNSNESNNVHNTYSGSSSKHTFGNYNTGESTPSDLSDSTPDSFSNSSNTGQYTLGVQQSSRTNKAKTEEKIDNRHRRFSAEEKKIKGGRPANNNNKKESPSESKVPLSPASKDKVIFRKTKTILQNLMTEQKTAIEQLDFDMNKLLNFKFGTQNDSYLYRLVQPPLPSDEERELLQQQLPQITPSSPEGLMSNGNSTLVATDNNLLAPNSPGPQSPSISNLPATPLSINHDEENFDTESNYTPVDSRENSYSDLYQNLALNNKGSLLSSNICDKSGKPNVGYLLSDHIQDCSLVTQFVMTRRKPAKYNYLYNTYEIHRRHRKIQQLTQYLVGKLISG